MSSTDPIVGTQFGHFFIRERVQAGGMAVVYQAFDQDRKQTVALKILHERYALQPQVVQRFRREAEIAKRLRHPNIVPFYEFDEIDGKLFMSMKFMEGGSLSDRLGRIANTPLGQTVAWLRQIGSALDFAHREGVIHRDLKPGNILLEPSGEALLSDFGIARIIDATQLTAADQQMPGTARYMSPEQASGALNLDYRTDLYSFGVIAYLLMTGRYPFTGTNDTVIIAQHISSMPPRASNVNSDLPPAVDDILYRILAKDPHQRQQSAIAFVDELTRAIVGFEDMMVIVDPRAENPASRSGNLMSPASTNSWGGAAPISSPFTMPVQPPPAQKKSGNNNTLMWIFLILLLLLVVGGFVLIALSGDDGNDTVAGLSTPADTATSIIAEETATIEIETPEVVPEPTEIPAPTDVEATDVELTGVSQSANVTDATSTSLPSDTPQPPTNTPLPSNTPALPTDDPVVIAQQTFAAIQTATADAWTNTPTPNFEATRDAELTRLAQIDLTNIALSSTPTATTTPSATATYTLTPTRIQPTPTPTIVATPDGGGQYIVFGLEPFSGGHELWLLDVETGETIFLAETGNAAWPKPKFTPNSRRVVFTSTVNSNPNIGIIDIDGRNNGFLISAQSSDNSGTLSPDGTQMLFDTLRNGRLQVYIANSNGNNQRLLIDNAGDPEWSPFGDEIAFTTNRHGGPLEIYVYNLFTGSQLRLTEIQGSASNGWPVWSPDGTRIAFDSDRDGNYNIYVMSRDGFDQVALTTNTAGDFRPAWSPDSSQIAFVSNRTGRNAIYIMNSDGSNQRLVFESPDGNITSLDW